MPSLIEQLQAEAMDPSVSIADLLRKAKVVATKLSLADAARWMDHESRGYPNGTAVPDYREIKVLLASIRSIAEGAAGDVVASGILQMLARPEVSALLSHLR